MNEETVAKVATFFENDPEVRLVLLFGSFVTGRVHAGSDVDVAVAYPDPLTLEYRVSKAHELSAKVNREVDIIDLREASGVLLQQILSHRKTLVNRDPEFYGNLIARRLREEADLMPLYERTLKSRRERFVDGKKGS